MKKDVYELTNPQKSIWLTEEFYKGTAINNICGNLIIREKLNFDKFTKAINLFVKTNESFNLKFFVDETTPKQYVSDFSEFNIEVIDVETEEDIRHIEEEMVSTPFNILDSLLFQFKLVRLPNGHGGFIVNIHHLISDAATFSILATEIVKIYSSLINNTNFEYNTNLYTNYIKSEKIYLQSEKFNKDKTYWNELYSSIPEVASIPSLLKQNSNDSLEALREAFVVPKDIFEKISVICKENKVSSYNLLMAIYAIYLGRVSNLDEFVIGTPILNRTNFIEKNTSGMFISTAPFKISINHEHRFYDFAKQIATDSIAMLRHQKYPYQYLLEDLRKSGNTVPNLYDFMFSYQITKATDKNLAVPYTTHWIGNSQIANSIEVHAHDNDDNGTITIAYDYKTSKFSKEDIAYIHNRIMYMLEQIIENSNLSLKDIEIVTPEEKHKILYEFNDTKADYNYSQNIILEIEKIAISHPNSIAIESDNASITYCELIKRVNKLSNMLINKLHIPENSILGIITNRTIDTIIGILSILKINCTYVPIDPSYPEARIEHMIETSKINHLFTDNNCILNVPKELNIINISYNTYYTENSKFEYKLNYNSNSNLYIIFTSGSTGKPKGVTLSHKNMLNLIYFEKSKTNIFSSSHDKILQFATMSFDVSYQEIFSSLLTASTLVLISEDVRKDMNKLSNYILNKHIDILFIPPAYLRLITESMENLNKLSKILKTIITAGEQLVITNGIQYLITNGVILYNHYGPAETHVATTYEVPKTPVTNPPIGFPISNCQILVIDNSNCLCPCGVLGQIVISGDCVGNGYYNNLDLTNKKFTKNKYNTNRTYFTGDLGYFDYSGCLHFVGRLDFQIKINGFRIELEEIDNILISNKCINSAKSIIIENNLRKSIVTYYTSNIKLSESDLFEYLKHKLPYYMIPTKLIYLKSFPLNINGKIDKNKLPAVNLIENDSVFIDASSYIEIHLRDIWKSIFNFNSISTNFNFFNIGGDSLLAIKLCSEIHKQLNIEINVQEIFSNPTISSLSKYIDNKSKSYIKEIPIIDSCDYYPVSSAQKRIYYSSKVANDGTAYNMPGGLILSQIPNIEKLEDCFKQIISRHESLRTYFDVVNGEVVQKVCDNINFKIELDNNICLDKYSAFLEFVKPFDLSKAPLIKVKLVQLKSNKALLLFDMHHIISDGASMQILINELCTLYNEGTLSSLDITYKDYSVWEQNNLEKDYFKKSEEYWVNQFQDDIPVLNLPTNYTRPTVQSFEGANIYTQVDEELNSKINSISKELNITPYMFLLSCYYILLYKYTSNNDIIVGTPIVGRDNSQINNLIGMFVNSLALRKQIDSNDSFYEFSIMVKDVCLNAFEHQTYPFDELISKLNITRDTSRNPLFDTMFIYQNNGNTPVNLGNIKSEYYIPDSNVSKFDLSLEVIPENSKLNLRFEYATKLFNKDFIQYLSIHYINILKTVIENRSIKIADIDILTEEEKHKILYEFNNNKMDYPKDKTIVQLFEEQVEKAPNNIAVVFEDQKLTYKELNEKANQLAHSLTKLSTKSNDIIGILLPRSIELITSIWGVLKAGAGYMLIDENLPNERIKYMLKNANAHMLLTNQGFKNVKYNPTLYLNNIELEKESNKNLNLNLSNENNLAVIYTSGSTGVPKGVLLKQDGLLNLINAFIKEMKIDTFTNFLSVASISFDMFTVETMTPILLGKSLILSNEEEQKDPYKLGALAKKHPIDFLITTPSRMDLFLSQENSKNMVANLKAFQLGGEVFSSSLYEKLSNVTNASMYNGYGPTEITACCSNKKVTNASDITIGKSLCNTNIIILDKDMNLCPINVPGELCVSGNGVAKGYINNVDATNKVFVKTNYLSLITYKTGDIAKYNENGELIYLGRNDNQIKIRGLRIELSEIETKILNLEKIEKCSVIYKKNSKNPHIVAFFTATQELEIANIRKELSKILPTYMIPKYIVQIDKMPITTNGKTNTKELYNIEFTVSDDSYIPPKTDKQKLFCIILENLLNVQVGITDDLFELGLDSLIAIKFKVELMNNNIDLPYASIFKYHTVKELCDSKPLEIDAQSVDTYNYDAINSLLNKNVFRSNINIKTCTTNNVLLLGSTGYVGMHIIKSFIEKDSGIIYCIVRDKNNISAKTRFIDTLHFYFGKKLDKYIDKRIIIFKGDLLKENFDLSTANTNILKENVSIVINSAANVKHYGSSEKFNNINVGLTKNLIDFCKLNNKRLIHLSSLSVSGNMVLDGTPNTKTANNKLTFSEKNLFISQGLDNVYTRSKFEAERLILDNINTGLNAQILRLGNITNRYSDGAFQINPKENAFLTRVRSLINISAIPKSMLSGYIEFTPVDSCSDSIVLIMQNYVKTYSVFHIYDYNHVYINKLIEIFKNLNINISVLSDENFANLLTELLKDPLKKKYVSGIINDLSTDKKLIYEGNVKVKSNFSIQFLEKIGFTWPVIDEKYVIKYIKYIRKNKFI